MVLIMAPALDGLKREWREAAENLGATRLAVLALCGAADPAALAARNDGAAVRQRLWRHATAFALTGGGARATW